jgi:hypothetical protein
VRGHTELAQVVLTVGPLGAFLGAGQGGQQHRR